MFQINFNFLKVLNIVLIAVATMHAQSLWAINVRCAVAIIDTELREIDASQFNKAFDVAIHRASQDSQSSRLPYGFIKLLSNEKFTEAELIKQLEEFYNAYRNNSHFLEEYKTKQEQKSESWITRYHSHYLWLVTQFIKPGLGSQSSSAILQEMALVNKTILEDLNIANLSSTPILVISDSIKKIVELRVAVYIELKLTNKNLSRNEILKLFHKLSEASIQDHNWKFLNEVVVQSNGQKNYLQALEILNDIRNTTQNEVTIKGYELAFYDIMRSKNLTSRKALNLYQKIYANWNAGSARADSRFNLEPHMILDFLRVGPEKLNSQTLMQTLEQSEFYRNQLRTHFAPERYKDSTNLLSLIYLAQLNRSGYTAIGTGNTSVPDSVNLALWQNSIAIYNQVFLDAAEVAWLREELFLDYILQRP